jgi:drug/metabolite transporter (DMT)-like permease
VLNPIVEFLYLPSVLLLTFIQMDETLSIGGIVGGLLVLSAVFVGAGDKKKGPHPIQISRETVIGIGSGVLAALFLAMGIVMIKQVLEASNLFWATLVRVASGALCLGVILLFHPGRYRYIQELKISRTWLTALPAAVCGNFVALLFWVAGMKYTTASRAAILNQMSTIFIFILATFFLKEKITTGKVVAICLAVTGACLTILSR